MKHVMLVGIFNCLISFCGLFVTLHGISGSSDSLQHFFIFFLFLVFLLEHYRLLALTAYNLTTVPPTVRLPQNTNTSTQRGQWHVFMIPCTFCRVCRRLHIASSHQQFYYCSRNHDCLQPTEGLGLISLHVFAQ